MSPAEPLKRVLIVDDEPNVAIILAESLEACGHRYFVETAENGKAALEKIQPGSYDLMITDYSMPEMDGLELALAARQIDPEMQIILMTAFGTDSLRDASGKLRLDGFVEKPFSMEKIREIVEQSIAHAKNAAPQPAAESGLDHSVHQHLQALQNDTGALCVVLLNSSGFPIDTAGQTSGVDITSMGVLVAANFMAAGELAKLLGKSSVFRSSYFEGQEKADDNIYAYAIDKEFLLVVVFGVESKPGSVWFYTKRTATALLPIMAKQDTQFLTFPKSGSETDANLTADNLATAGLAALIEPGKVLTALEAVERGILPPDFDQNESLYQAFDSELDKLFEEDPVPSDKRDKP